jgi:hypothetical protein
MTMKHFSIRLLAAIVTSLLCWTIIDRLVIPMPLYTFLLIEAIITIMQRLYTWQLKKLNHVTNQ